MKGDIGGQRGLPHTGSASQDDEIGFLQPAKQLVKGSEARPHTRYAARCLGCLIRHLERGIKGHAERVQPALPLIVLGQVEEPLFSLLDHGAGRGVEVSRTGLADQLIR